MIAVLPTVDVEGAHGARPFEQLALGRVGGGESWGALRLAEVFNEFHVRGTFFVDVYEHTLWGEAPLRRLCEQLRELGHDVELHTHPSWADDDRDHHALRLLKRERCYLPQHLDLMAKLSEEVQVKVLEDGAGLLERWLGERPRVHRSGGYSINEDTIRALRRVGIPVDSSMNAAHRNSRLRWSANTVVARDGILELPITVLDLALALPRGRRLPVKRLATDLDGCGAQELFEFARQAVRAGLPIMNLSMHSYSLLRFDPDFRRIVPAPAMLDRLRRVLAGLVADPDVRVMSCHEYHQAWRAAPSAAGGDVVPVVAGAGRLASLAVTKLATPVVRRLAAMWPSRARHVDASDAVQMAPRGGRAQ
jgi:peptidoglycan/xylan/chitin deacetylase (PgdA/CDA1 family)